MRPRSSITEEDLLSSRWKQTPRVGSRVSESRIAELRKVGRQFLDLRAYPYRSLPENITDVACRAARELTQAPARGLVGFREAIAARLATEVSVPLDPERNVLATSGAMHALHLVFSVILNPGDQVLVPSPCYFLEGLVVPWGGEIVHVPVKENQCYAWDIDRLESKITPRTKCIFVNTPVNPTGYVLSRRELRELTDLAERYNLLLISDESYDILTYDGRQHLSVAVIPGAFERTLLVRSFTKSFAMPGWRVGYAAGPTMLIDALAKTLEWTMLYGGYVNQVVATAVLEAPKDWLAGVAQEFQAARDLVCDGIRLIEGISCVTPAGGPFLFLNVSGLGLDGDRASELLIEHFGIPVTAGSSLQSRDHVRIALGAPPASLNQLVVRLGDFAERVRSRRVVNSTS